MEPTLAVIVAAGGTGERFGGPQGKQLVSVAGRPLLTWTLEALDGPDVGLIVVVCHPRRVDEFEAAVLGSARVRAPLRFVPGGSSRQESVSLGLDAVGGDFDHVAVHDGARPLVHRDLLHAAVEMLSSSECEGVVVGHPAYDTLKVVDGDRVLETPDRSRYWVAQTPQVFKCAALRKAYAAAFDAEFEGTDDSSLVERDGGIVVMLRGPRDNVKVTTPEDILFVESVLRLRAEREAQ